MCAGFKWSSWIEDCVITGGVVSPEDREKFLYLENL